LDFLAPAREGGRGVGVSDKFGNCPFPHGKGSGDGWCLIAVQAMSPSSAHRLKIPPQVPLVSRRGRRWGERGGLTGAADGTVRLGGPAAQADGVTGLLAQRLQRRRPPCPGGPASSRPTCHQAAPGQRLARRSSRTDHFQMFNAFSGPASGVASARGDGLGTPSASRGRRSRTREGNNAADPRARERAAVP